MAFGRGGLVPSQILFSKDAVAHNCRHLPSSKRTDATANCVLIIDTASIIRCLNLHRSTAKWCYTPLPTLISQARSLCLTSHFVIFELRDLLSIESQTQSPPKKFQRNLNISITHARLQRYPIGPHFFGTICSVLMYLPSLSRQTTSIWLSTPCSNSLHLRSVQCLYLPPLLDTHRTTALVVFPGNTLSLFWTILIILDLAALTFASVRLNVCVSVAASSTNCWEAF